MNNFDESAIFDILSGIIRSGNVSKNVYPNRPVSFKTDLSDFVVCRVSGRISDLAAYGSCTVAISLFAKDVSNIKNKDKLSVMQSRLIASIPRDSGDFLTGEHPDVLGDAPDGNGYHARIINYQVIIKTI